MRTLSQLLERIAYRERRQLALACLGVPASILQFEASVTADLRLQHTQRVQRIQDTYHVGVSS